MPHIDTFSNRKTKPPRLTFIHIPKTAGASIIQSVARLYDQSKVAPFIYEGKTEIADPQAYDLFSGHMGYTMARSFNTPIATVLRDPVDRVVSLYHFWRAQKQSVIPEGMSLDEFITSDNPGFVGNVRNTQTWQIAYTLRIHEQRRLKLSKGAILARAILNLENMAIVGVLSKMSTFTDQLSVFLGQELQQLPRVNTLPDRTPREPISESTRARIMEVNDLDSLLYDFAISRL